MTADCPDPEILFRSPSRALRPYVRLLQHTSEGAGQAGWRRHVPSGSVVLVINFASPFQRMEPNHGARELPHAWLGGPRDHWVLTGATGLVCCLEAHLTPVGAHRLVREPMHSLANRATDLEDLLGPGARFLRDQLQEAPALETRFDLLESFIAERVNFFATHDEGVEWAWRQLRDNPVLGVGDLADELGWSHKRLIVSFREYVGLTPKRVARVHRFRRATDLLGKRQHRLALSEVAQACGYYDQSHLNREFVELSGVTPGAFLSQHLRPGLGVRDTS